MDAHAILQEARRVLGEEAKALSETANSLGDVFTGAVKCLYSSPGKIIVSGVGKSELIGRKMAATFTSTGTPALCMHATDALHGDIGIVQPGDVAILISRSGSTAEVLNLLPALKARQVPIIAITCFSDSPLSRSSDFHLQLEARTEACPHGLAPTTSTTATLAIGDALAVCLLRLRNFTDKDFARVHPSGSLGRQLLLKARDLIRRESPTVSPDTPFEQVILSITQGRFGATVVTDAQNRVLGIITDGDLRRLIMGRQDFSGLKAESFMTHNPKTAPLDIMATDALIQMENARISQLLLIHPDQTLAGILHIHDLITEGIRS